MAKKVTDEEHQRLANIVKEMHGKLRKQLRETNGDYEKVWDSHCANKEALKKYASAMHVLAVNHWAKQSPEGRVEWCHRTAIDFFKRGGLGKLMEKQKRRREFSLDVNACCCCFETNKIKDHQDSGEKLHLLDVGSCFNPFSVYHDFYSVAIDLQPAASTVHKCDFLNLDVQHILNSRQQFSCCKNCGTRQISLPQEDSSLEEMHNPSFEKDTILLEEKNAKPMHSRKVLMNIADGNPVSDNSKSWCLGDFINEEEEVTILPAGLFHIIVFSLLLSYFPSPVQRWECCKKAHRLLITNGILLIITPDSSHQNKNAAMIKSWKTGIESLGFVRWKYHKQTHLHCMAFRKVAPCHTYNHVNGSADLMYVPQDFQEEDEEVSDSISSFCIEKDESQIMEWLSELSDL
ncbi:S-adenosylmethionine sensor upstream of mTORC1-like isoform X1 [Montipora foliosa]|uniref:S-adenosylmethionine sensor upstream of mTORC1-like isoform X1 n=1 Tax=Montipora foliosa TaxID=591990 RepID=UPI0035F1425D